MGNQEEESWFWSQRKAVGKNREKGEEWARTCRHWMHLPTMCCSDKGNKSHSTGLIVTALLLTPWNQAASTNECDTSAGRSCNCFWMSSGPLRNHTTKHLGHRRSLLAHWFATKENHCCSMHSTVLKCTHCMQKAAHITCNPGKMFAWSGLAKSYLPLSVPAPPSSLLINWSPHLAHTLISKKTWYIFRINTSNVI